MNFSFFRMAKRGPRIGLDEAQRKKIDELLFEEEKNGERRVNRILRVFLVFLFFMMGLTLLVGEVSWKMLPNAIGFGIMTVYTIVMYVLLRKGVYKPFFKYLTISFCVSMVTLAVVGYIPYSGWTHSLRTCSLILHFIIIGLSGFYQNPKVPIYTGILSSLQYSVHFFAAVFLTDTPIVHLETFAEPAISYDVYVVYAFLFVFAGIIVGFVARRLRVVLEQSIRFEAEAQLKQELELAHGKLKEMDRYKTDFFQNITHELRTPLALVLGPVESLIQGSYGKLPHAASAELTVVRQNATRLLHLINQILDLSKLDAKRMRLAVRSLDLVRVLEYIAASFESRARGKGIGFVLRTDPDRITAWIDREKFEKIVFNLLSNAFKFTGSGGRIELSATGRDDMLDVAVSDTGCGIPPAELPFVFERFRQVDGSNTRKRGGTGIGLSIVREYARLHRGEVTATSESGKGSRFVLSIPNAVEAYAPDEIDPSDAPDEATAAEGYFIDDRTSDRAVTAGRHTEQDARDRETVLVVEDNVMMQGFIRDSLTDVYHVLVADDGEAGLECVRERRPDLVVSDIMMPRMDGNTLLRTLKGDPATAEIPVVLLTARVSEDMRLEGLESGADDYLPKPFNPRELRARVANLMRILAQKKALARMNERLVRSENMKELLAGAVVHDIKNYASAIELSMKFIQKQYESDPRTLRNVQAVRASCVDIINLSLNLIDIRKMEEGAAVVRPRRYTADEIVGLARRHAENPAYDGKGLAISFSRLDDCDDVFSVSADPFYLDRVLGNLFHNALKYTPAGGAISLGFERNEHGNRITLFNAGEPIPAEQRTVIFEKYLGSHEGRSKYSRGLGLSFCSMAMDSHGGRIRVEPSCDGNTFILEFPPG